MDKYLAVVYNLLRLLHDEEMGIAVMENLTQVRHVMMEILSMVMDVQAPVRKKEDDLAEEILLQLPVVTERSIQEKYVMMGLKTEFEVFVRLHAH